MKFSFLDSITHAELDFSSSVLEADFINAVLTLRQSEKETISLRRDR